jgi:hypothetical protein
LIKQIYRFDWREVIYIDGGEFVEDALVFLDEKRIGIGLFGFVFSKV